MFISNDKVRVKKKTENMIQEGRKKFSIKKFLLSLREKNRTWYFLQPVVRTFLNSLIRNMIERQRH